jgi:glycosyltransferase involved in cell wall biosynthesis
MKVQKITVVTVCLNVRDCIRLTLESVTRQSFGNIEHVIIDGGSNDGTQNIIKEYPIGYFVSKKDNGVYDAMDKGAQAATGDILIFLNAGDTFYDDQTCENIATFFNETKADIIFGNLMPVYLNSTDSHDHEAFTSGKLLDLGYIRNRSQLFDESIHHQATFYRRWIFNRCTYSCPSPEATGEYNLLLNATMHHNAKVKHIPRPIARFVLGGISTRNFAIEWDKYVKARDALRAIYCPKKHSIKIKNKSEFCHVNTKNNPLAQKIYFKSIIKNTFAFKVYERLSNGISSRLLNKLAPKFEELLELQTRRILNDLTLVLEKKLGARFDDIYKTAICNANKNELAIAELKQVANQTKASVAEVYIKVNTNNNFSNSGFKVFSQWNEDGLIQYLITKIGTCTQPFVEIGVGDYSEANTRFLLEKNNWRGMIVDSSEENMNRVRANDLYWRHNLDAVYAFVDSETINELLLSHGMHGEIGLLSIDVDGVDYWIWKAINVISPQIVICEYNGIFGSKAKVTVPYDPKFDRTSKHYSWLYAGASLAALDLLAQEKGYTLIGTNNGGNNAFFVRNDVLKSSEIIPSQNPYTKPMFRESRNRDGSQSYLDITEGINLIKDLDVVDVETNATVKIKDISMVY